MEKNKPILAGRRNYWLMKKWMNDTLAAVKEEGIVQEDKKMYEWKCPITGIIHYSNKPFPEKKEEAPKCESRWKRLELMSGSGSWIAKDDKAEAGAWDKATEPFDFGKERVPDLDPDTFVSRKGILTRYGKKKYTQIKSSYGTTVTIKDEEAAKERGICIQSVSGHSLVMEDYDDKEVLPPWNTETYNGSIDEEVKPIVDWNDKTTYPHIYGFRTPQKHTIGYKEGDNGNQGTISEPDRR